MLPQYAIIPQNPTYQSLTFSSSSWFVHLQNNQKQTFASDDYHVATTAENL